MKRLLQISIVAGAISFLASCNNQDSCEDVNCLNDGVCVEGTCICPDGFSGPNCEIESFENGVFVLHEGNFQGGNASLSFLNLNNLTMTNGVFTSVNTIPLGDVAQSMTIIGNKGYIVVNNSSKIEVVNLSDLSSLGTVSSGLAPRYISAISDTKAYVSDFISGDITVFDPQTLLVTGQINVNSRIEEVLKVGNYVYAANQSLGRVLKIDMQNDSIIGFVDIGEGTSQLTEDANGKVWVMTNGGWGIEEPKLARINPADMSIELSLEFTLSDFPSSLKTNADGTSLYWANGGVFKMDITETNIPTSAFISTAVYKVNANPADDMIYVSDAADFNSNGKVYRYTATGTPVDTFNVGVIPGEFTFTD